MRRLIIAALLCTVVTPAIAVAQAPSTSPADYVLVTVILKHDQSRNLDEITKLLDEQGFWAKFPPDGIVVESWYVMMGLGHVATLRVPPARLREFNRSIEAGAWKAFRSEIYATYDFKEARRRRGSARSKSDRAAWSRRGGSVCVCGAGLARPLLPGQDCTRSSAARRGRRRRGGRCRGRASGGGGTRPACRRGRR
jgi:hypothetical protein